MPMNSGQPFLPEPQESEIIWQRQSESRSAAVHLETAGVVVSLYNYADCILDTLDTIVAQSQDDLDLVVVDDASSDAGADRVQQWMQMHGHHFVATTLLRHRRNCGLAAARNTGFLHARAAWVWVQDADNPLAPWALEQVLRLARRVHPRVAVIHPLLLCEPQAAASSVFQGGGQPWQRSMFLRANCVDAMALVRHQAWQSVGGYSHIEGGWEDYDFWCKLIEAGWYGVQCPQVLGSYRLHDASMTATTALPNVEKLEAYLQARHPWLDCLGRTSGERT